MKWSQGQRAYRIAAAALVIVAAASTTGCPDKRAGTPERKVRVFAVEVSERTPPPLRVAGIDEPSLERRVKQSLKNGGVVQLIDEEKDGAYRVRLDVALRQDVEGQVAALVLARGQPAGDGIVLQASTVSKVGAKSAPADRRKKVLLQAIDAALEDLMYQARLSVAPPAELVQALRGKDAARLAAAVEIAAVRRLRPAVPVLIDLLRHPKEEVADRAIGALVAIGDRRAVKPMTRLSKFTDTARMAKVLDAIGALGGREAREYLEFVAVGHDDADIRNMAREALERMTRREKSADPATGQ